MARQSSTDLGYEHLVDGYAQSGGATRRRLQQVGGDVEINAENTAIYTFPNATDTVVLEAYAQTLTNKTIDADFNTITNIGASEVEPGLINDLSVLVTLDKDNDYVMVLDSDTGTLKKTTVRSLIAEVGEHAEMYMNENATETVISAIDTPVLIAGTTTAGLLSTDFTHANQRLTYTGIPTGKFLVTVSLSIESAGINNILATHIAKNGTVQAKSQIDRFVSTGGDEGAVSMNAILELTTNDYIEIYASNSTNTGNVTVTHLNVSVVEIAGTLVAVGGGAGDVYSFITDGGVTAAASGSDTIKFRSSDGSIAINVFSNDVTHGDNVDFVLGAVPWANITNTPTTLAGYGITDAYTITELQTSGSATVHWNNLTNIPTYDNYQGWGLKVNSDPADTITSLQTVNVVQGANMTITYDALTNTVTFAAASGGGGSSTYLGLSDTPIAFNADRFVMNNGTGDGLVHVAANDILLSSFNNDLTYDNYQSWTISDSSNTKAITSLSTLSIVGGTGVTTSLNTTTNTLTITATASGMTSFNITESGTTYIVTQGQQIQHTDLGDGGLAVTLSNPAAGQYKYEYALNFTNLFAGTMLLEHMRIAMYSTQDDVHMLVSGAHLNSVLIHDDLDGYIATEHVDHASVSINTFGSLTGGGNITASRTLSLVNDVVSPGNMQYYGTNTLGTKGYHSLTNAIITVSNIRLPSGGEERINNALNFIGGGFKSVIDNDAQGRVDVTITRSGIYRQKFYHPETLSFRTPTTASLVTIPLGGYLLSAIEFPQSVDNVVGFHWAPPTNIDLDKVGFIAHWVASTETGVFRSIKSSGSIDDGENSVTFNPYAENNHIVNVAGEYLPSAYAANITPGGTPTKVANMPPMLFFEIGRQGSNVADTLATNVYLIGVSMHYLEEQDEPIEFG